MKFCKSTCALLFSVFLLASCNESSSTITDLENLIEEIDDLPENYSKDDLVKISDEYEGILEEFKKHEYDDEQTKEINKLHGKFTAKMTKASLRIIGRTIDEFGKQIEDGMKAFQEEMEKD